MLAVTVSVNVATSLESVESYDATATVSLLDESAARYASNAASVMGTAVSAGSADGVIHNELVVVVVTDQLRAVSAGDDQRVRVRVGHKSSPGVESRSRHKADTQ